LIKFSDTVTGIGEVVTADSIMIANVSMHDKEGRAFFYVHGFEEQVAIWEGESTV
jgi:hypothetical protein